VSERPTRRPRLLDALRGWGRLAGVSSTNLPVTREPSAVTEPETSSSTGSSLAGAPFPQAADAQATDPSTEPPRSDPEPADLPTEPDPVAAAAVDLARAAAEDVAEPNTVGAHLGVSLDEGGLTMHSFGCTARGYRGWQWAVTLARVPGTDTVTVCDAVLLPGAESILAPTWVPWSDRLAPGDLGAGDDLPYRADDPYLVPGYTVTDPDDADQMLFWELGLGRERVVGAEGLHAAADRWQRGPHGPTSDIAIQASAMCASCAYFVPISGLLRQHFGACTNEWSPADGSVVTTDFGCGAHSETDLELPAPEPLPDHIIDETIVERVIIDRGQAQSDLDDGELPTAEVPEIEVLVAEAPRVEVPVIDVPPAEVPTVEPVDAVVEVAPAEASPDEATVDEATAVEAQPVDATVAEAQPDQPHDPVDPERPASDQVPPVP
jgi:hypothetical protein